MLCILVIGSVYEVKIAFDFCLIILKKKPNIKKKIFLRCFSAKARSQYLSLWSVQKNSIETQPSQNRPFSGELF